MEADDRTILAQGRTDGGDHLIEADDPLRELHLACGGEIPGTLAIPELLALVRKSRHYGLRLARMIRAIDGDNQIQAWVEVEPQKTDGGGCHLVVASWQISPIAPEDEFLVARRRLEIERATAELVARLDTEQKLLTVEADAPDLVEALAQMKRGLGRPWTDFVELHEQSHHQPMHWRLLDGARCRIGGSHRDWTASLVALGRPGQESSGFELYLVASTALADPQQPVPSAEASSQAEAPHSLGRELSPVLRKPISRIIANAETIRTRLAGPIADEYSDYAADIASAGQHLLSLLDDLTDLEVVEAEGFSTAPDRIDLMDIARRATGILGVRARERQITLEIAGDTKPVLAIGEFRRVLQILLNVLGNAIRYSPEESTVTVSLARTGDRALMVVSDQGPGLSQDQREKLFRKFERLGRSGDGGSGLGLYISKKLALAMGGDLTVDSEEGEGASFTLALPALEDGRKKPR